MKPKNLQTSDAPERRRESLREFDLSHPALGYVVAIGAVAAAALARGLLGSVLANRAPWIFFFPAVMATAWGYGAGPGTFAIVTSLAIGTVAFVRAGQPFLPMPQQEFILLILYILSAGFIVALGATHHHNRDRLAREAEERRRAQESLAESLEMFRGIFDNARGTAIVLTDTERRILAWNQGAVSTFGWSEREAFGKRIEALVPPDDAPLQIAEVFGEEPVQTERWLRRKDGTLLWGSAVTTELHHPDGRIRGYLTIIRDMTERREYEELLQRQNEELDHRVRERTADLLQANAELEGFTYSVSHDMRAPLRGIIANSAMLVEDFGGDLPEPARAMLERLSGSALKMSRLVEDLLTYARLGKRAPNAVPTNLSELFREVVEEEAPDLDMEVSIEEDLHAMCDPGLMRMVIQNLVGNAVKYRCPSRPFRLSFALTETEDGPAFCVEDNGTGFDPSYAHKLFQPFERLHRDEQIPGTGIGLANVKRIVERHGGRVWAEGIPGLGAKFWFTIAG